MKTSYTNHTINILSRWIYFLSVILTLALIVPAVAFSQPTLVSPADATLNVSTGPTLTWSTVATAVTYHLQVSLSSGFGTTVYDNDVSGVSQVVTPVLANGTQYYWHVSDNVDGLGNYSAYQSFTTNPIPIDLGTAGNFRILANTGITGGAGSHITGDIGCLAAASTITGFNLVLDGGGTFATSSSVTGKVYAFNYAGSTPTNLTAAAGFMGTAYTNAANRTPIPVGTFLNAGSGEIGNLNLGPGLYKWTSAVTISNDLTLTGNSTDVWIFQIASTLDMANGKQIILVGALSSNVFWQVADQVTLIGTSAMKGIILGQTGIAMGDNGTLDGRALAQANVTLIHNTVLPVELTSFTATGTRSGAMLAWKTATEKNNFGFNIERRTVGSSVWNKVGFVAGHGTSNIANSYSYADANVAAGSYAYRVAQVDNDGTVKAYNESEVTIGAAAKVLTLGNYPNPFNPTTTFEFSVPNDGLTIVKIYNVLGQEVLTAFSGEVKAGTYQHATFDGSKFSSGVYFYAIENSGQRMIKKMLMLK
jgi:Ice-binding-like/Secretion system C-terminal sorting domain